MEKVKTFLQATEVYIIFAMMALQEVLGQVNGDLVVATWISRVIVWLGGALIIVRRVALLPKNQRSIESYTKLMD